MGFYRLILALLVVLTHLGLQFGPIVEGVSALTSFYLLSGFVMPALVGRYYAAPARYWSFLADRAVRLCPQFFIYLLLTILALVVFKPPSQVATVVTPLGILLNGLIVPLGLAWFMLQHRDYMPQAWSLGLEVMFYLVFPFLFIYRLRHVALVLSFLYSLLALSGTIDNALYGSLLPGNLYIFMLGSLIYDRRADRWPGLIIFAWGIALALLCIVLWRIDTPYNKELLLGLLIGLPAVWLLRFQPSPRLDAMAGNLSYGVFLNHFAIIFALQGLGVSVGDALWATAIILSSLIFAWLTYRFAEAPCLNLRRSLRIQSS